MNVRTRTIGLTAIAIAAAVAPVSFRPQNIVSGGPVFRLQDACGQATECEQHSRYICSTVRSDHQGYKCSAGCSSAFEEEVMY